MVHGTISTPLGNICYQLTDATHVHLRETEIAVPLLVNNVRCHASVHLYQQEDGSWGLKGADNSSPYTNLYLSRSDDAIKMPSDAARKKVLATFVQVWTETVTDDMRIEAEADHTREERAALLEEIKELKRKLSNAKNQEVALTTILDGLAGRPLRSKIGQKNDGAKGSRLEVGSNPIQQLGKKMVSVTVSMRNPEPPVFILERHGRKTEHLGTPQGANEIGRILFQDGFQSWMFHTKIAFDFFAFLMFDAREEIRDGYCAELLLTKELK